MFATHKTLLLAVLMLGSLHAAAAPPVCGRMPLEQVKEIDFYVYFPSEAGAIDAASQVDESVFDVVVRTSATGEDWLLRAVYRELPSPEAHSAHATAVASLAKAHGGTFHGAGCASRVHRREAGA